MGTGFSASLSDCNYGDCYPSETSFSDLPESCVALILMRLHPPEICRLARLSRAFRNASTADFIWESKLPPNYRVIAEKVFDHGTLANLGLKELYARLCRPIPFDAATKELWLDKNSGRLCLSISSRALKITGIDDRRHWTRISTQQSRFHSVAYLQQIWWLEVYGELEIQFPCGTYSLLFRLQLGKPSNCRRGRRACSTEHIHGWDVKPVRFQLSTSDGQQAVSQCYLENPGSWVNYHVGDFTVEKPNTATKVKFSMTQIDCTHTKGGLCVDSALIFPKEMGRNGLCGKGADV